MLKATWEVDLEQDRLSHEPLYWRPYFSWLRSKLHSWSWKFGHSWMWPFYGRAPHDWLVKRKWYKAWGRRRDIYDDSWIRKPAEDIAKAIDSCIADEIERKIREGEYDL